MIGHKKIYEEIDGVKYEVKNQNRKNIVKFYQEMVINSHAEYVERNRMFEKKRVYSENLLKNVLRAPFVFGWLFSEKKEAESENKQKPNKNKPKNKDANKNSVKNKKPTKKKIANKKVEKKK